MKSKQLLFEFADLSSKDKPIKALTTAFNKAGAQVISADVDSKTKRTAGISFKEISVSFADSQTLTLRVKQSGDIFEVLLNGKVLPIRQQDDHYKAVSEIVKAMDAGRSKFQEKLAKAQAKLPPAIKTAAPSLEKMLDQKIIDLTEAIGAAKEQLAQLTGEAA